MYIYIRILPILSCAVLHYCNERLARHPESARAPKEPPSTHRAAEQPESAQAPRESAPVSRELPGTQRAPKQRERPPMHTGRSPRHPESAKDFFPPKNSFFFFFFFFSVRFFSRLLYKA